MSEELKQEKTKQPLSPEKKAKRNRIITFVCGGVGLLVLTIFSIFAFKPTAKVSFVSNGGTLIESIQIDRKTGKIEVPENPTKDHHDFLGWYDNKKFEGEPIDLSTHEFKEGDKLIKTTLFAKWELHKYIIEVKNVDTDEVINITDEDGNPINFYITYRHEGATDAEIEQYINVNGGPDVVTPDKAKTEMNKLANADELPVEYIANINQLSNFDKANICDEGGNPLLTVSRKNLEAKYDENGKELPVITIYVKNYSTEE